jgi:RHS repeat-associated protein
MIKSEKGWVYTDRLGSIGKFYPYGVERPSATANGTEKFTGYFRDAETGLDYADQRYESPGTGRFLTPDRMGGNPADPGSWNKYAYTRGDPVNRVDPGGMDDCPVNYCYVMNVTDTFSLLDLQPILDFGTGWSTGAMPWGASAIQGAIQNATEAAILLASQNGAATADKGLAQISSGGFASKSKCTEFFQELVGENSLTITADELIAEVMRVASAAEQYLYDGPSATSVPLDPTKFPGANSSGASTVSQWFGQSSGTIALSQFNGAAIWIKTAEWSGFLSPFVSGGNVNQYGLGTLLHELLHKEVVGGGVSHDQMINALQAIGAYGSVLGRNDISNSLGSICF